MQGWGSRVTQHTVPCPLASVPTKDPSGKSLIISPEEFERIKWASSVQTREEREAQEQALQKEKDRMLVATGHRGHCLPTGGHCPARRGVTALSTGGSLSSH